MAVVVSSTIGDSFASVLMNVPGGGGAAATMVDGFPMARRGEAARALSAALTTSTAHGLLWGAADFLFLPYYVPVVMYFGIPEMFAFTMLALVAVVFVNNQYWVRGILALALGVFLGLVGLDPSSGTPRFTGGWFYLADGIQMAPVMAGFLAVPELLEALRVKSQPIIMRSSIIWNQIKQGMKDSWQYRWDGLRGGVIGSVIGLLPGIGGSIADWLAYGQTVAMNPKEKIPFGEGNIKGVIGCEGANNAQKATAYVPTVLFGVPGAPFEAIVMALLMYVGLEMGSPSLLSDQRFFSTLNWGYMSALVLSFILGVIAIRYAVMILNVPIRWYVIPVLVLIVWSCVQYTGGWEDYAIFFFCAIGGIIFKYFKLNRAAFIIGFVLAERIESIGTQFFSLYSPIAIIQRPISLTLLMLMIAAIIYGLFFNKAKISYN